MAEYIAKDGEERGALMLEAIALLGLMTMMSPMVVRQTADRTAEMEEVAVAGQMKTLRDALSSYIEANYAGIAAEGGNTRAVTLDQLRPYLPPSFIQGGAVSNKLINDYNFRLRKECTDGAAPNCNRWKIMGLVVSGRANDGTAGGAAELDVRRAARIATMIGADGGYTPSTASGQNGNVIRGAQGIWEGNVTDFGIAADSARGRVVAATTYASSVGGDFLYRHAVNGLPEANSMFTDIDMSGQGTGAHRIRHSGGLEVINGKIVVRRNRVNDWNSNNNEAVHIDQNNITSRDVNVSMRNGQLAFNLDSADATLMYGGNIGLGMDSTGVGLVSSGASLDLGGDHMDQRANGTIAQQANNIGATARNELTLQSTNAMKLTSTSGAVNIKGASGSGLDKGINLTPENNNGRYGTSSSWYGLFMRSSTPTEWTGAAGAKNRMVGGLNLYTNYCGSADCSPFSLSARSFNGNDVYLAVSQKWSDAKGLILHGTTSKNASHTDFQGMDVWSGGAYRGDRTYSADVHLGVIGSGADNEQNGGRLQLGAHERMRVNLYGRANGGGFMEMYSAQTKSDTPVLSAVLGASQAANGNSTGGLFALGAGYGNVVNVRNGAGYQTNNDAVFYMNAKTADANMPHFSPYKIALKASPSAADAYGFAVQNHISANYTEQGTTSATDTTLSAGAGQQTIANQLTNANGSIYTTYGANTVSESVGGKSVSYNRFEVDPAFVSVMNDIKLTSRGGAHLADILPNYINKGIYVLSNTYASGPWPCDSSNCTFNIPRVKKTDGGAIVTGAWESDCTAMRNYLKGGASCTPGTNHLRVSYYASSYTQCPAGQACLTHPYLGAVPAPGRSVTVGSETMAAYDEGPCPDGYLPVMTVTPTAIEVGKVNHIDMRIDLGGATEDNYVYYNLENVDFSSHRASIYQPATSVSTAIQSVDASGSAVSAGGTIHGWKVALGTVSTSTSGGYYWNQGGVWQDSMKAVAHTYCYFNPSRFRYPNMLIYQKVMKAMPAPHKWNN